MNLESPSEGEMETLRALGIDATEILALADGVQTRGAREVTMRKLYDAVNAGDSDLRTTIKDLDFSMNDFDPSFRDEKTGSTILHAAVLQNDVESAKLLCQLGCSIDDFS